MSRVNRGIGFWVRRLCFFLFLFFCVIQLQYILRIVWFNYFEPASTPYIRSQLINLAEQNKPLRYQWVDYKHISSWVPKAIIAAEDTHFMQHNGVEWSAIWQAFNRNLIQGNHSPGGSSLTQQTVKNLLLTHERSYFRKAEEIFLALVMDLFWSKKRILEVYMNIAEFGNGIFGIEAASRHYYHRSAKHLTQDQAIWLSAILASPKRYEKERDTPFLRYRLQRIQTDIHYVHIPK